jgi:hypothetical protein
LHLANLSVEHCGQWCLNAVLAATAFCIGRSPGRNIPYDQQHSDHNKWRCPARPDGPT